MRADHRQELKELSSLRQIGDFTVLLSCFFKVSFEMRITGLRPRAEERLLEDKLTSIEGLLPFIRGHSALRSPVIYMPWCITEEMLVRV